MEDALVRPIVTMYSISTKGLNPCCNGRCTRTLDRQIICKDNMVLILVVMEDALVPCFLFSFCMIVIVLILVVMEDALVLGMTGSFLVFFNLS